MTKLRKDPKELARLAGVLPSPKSDFSQLSKAKNKLRKKRSTKSRHRSQPETKAQMIEEVIGERNAGSITLQGRLIV